MNARFAHVFSRLSIVSVAFVSAVGATACSRADTSSTSAPVAAAPASSTEAEHKPGAHLFRHVEALDLRPDQRASVGEIQENLAADLSVHRETIRQVAGLIADGVESGKLDADEAAAQQAALTAAVRDARGSFASAMNDVHDLLDAGQRTALVERLRAQHARASAGDADTRASRIDTPDADHTKAAAQLGLSDEQKATLRDAIRTAVEDIFPDRKAKREAMEARMKAMSDAFVSDDFDAADWDLGGDAEHAITSFSEAASRAIDVSSRVLSSGQRVILAELIRSRAARF